MAKSDTDAKVQKLVKEAEEKLRAKYEVEIERELKGVEARVRKYFEEQDEPDVSLFLGDGPRKRKGGRSGTTGTKSCSVCELEGTRLTATAKKALGLKHSPEEHKKWMDGR